MSEFDSLPEEVQDANPDEVIELIPEEETNDDSNG